MTQIKTHTHKQIRTVSKSGAYKLDALYYPSYNRVTNVVNDVVNTAVRRVRFTLIVPATQKVQGAQKAYQVRRTRSMNNCCAWYTYVASVEELSSFFDSYYYCTV